MALEAVYPKFTKQTRLQALIAAASKWAYSIKRMNWYVSAFKRQAT